MFATASESSFASISTIFPPAHAYDVNAMVARKRAVPECIGCGPADYDDGIMRQTFHPDVIHRNRKTASEDSTPSAANAQVKKTCRSSQAQKQNGAIQPRPKWSKLEALLC
jgi:hypothetical protein